MRLTIAAFCVAMGLAAVSAQAAPTTADKCEASKNKVAGSYFSCRQKAEATAISKATTPDYGKCTAKFDDKWDGAETKGEMMCPDNVLTAPMNAFIAAQAAQTASIISGAQNIPTCGDGVVNVAGEECDGMDLGGNTCASLGLPGSLPLQCDVSCQLDASSCVTHACAGDPQWQPVDCTTTDWVWSTDRSIATTLADANYSRILAVGDQHVGTGNTCSLDGTGWVSTSTFVMSGCNDDWYHIGGSFTGDCFGHDGDVVRRLVLGPYDCYDY